MINASSIMGMYKAPVFESKVKIKDARVKYSDQFVLNTLIAFEKHKQFCIAEKESGVQRNTIRIWVNKYTVDNVLEMRAKARKVTRKFDENISVARRINIVKLASKGPIGPVVLSKELGFSGLTIRNDVRLLIKNGYLIDVSVRRDAILVEAA